MNLKKLFVFLLFALFLGAIASCATNHFRENYKNLSAYGILVIPMNQQVVLIIPSDKLFVLGTDKLTYEGKATLNQIVVYLQQVQYSNIHIAGNTDPVFDHTLYHGQDLSLLQAKEVAGYLWDNGVNHHIARRQLTYSGEDADQPIATNSTLEGMKKNRRIQITIYAGKLEESGVSSPFKTQYQW